MSFTKSDFVLQLEGFIAGISKHYAGATLQMGGQAVPASTVVTTFQACIDACNAVEPVEVARTAAVAKADATVAAARPLARTFKAMVYAAYDTDAAVLADFRLEPRKEPVTTPAARVAAAKKAAATRKALGTMGSRQKKEAKAKLAAGSVANVEPTEPAEPAPTAAPATPAAPAAPKA